MKIYGIIGWPLGHSFSKHYFSGKFTALGLDGYRYLEFPLEDIRMLPGILTSNPDLCGFNVTIPHKKAVIELLDDISCEALAIGAVNCVKIEGGKLRGYNTDVRGFGAGLGDLIGDSRPKALVLGTGGASSAVRYELKRRGIEYITVSRVKSPVAISYGELTDEIMESHKLIINTTPLGMWPSIDSKPDIPYERIGHGYFLYDLVYNPTVTAFLAEGLKRGAAVLNGEKMLREQADENWRIWNDPGL